MSEHNQARRDGKLKFGYDFGSLAEVTHLWGLTATKLPYRNAFRIPERENAIVCLLSENGGSGWRNIPHYGLKTDSRGWREIVRIDEVNSDSKKSAQRVEDELAKPLERYVFWRERRDGANWYKFYGAFELDVAATQASKEAGENVCIYRKASDEGECPKCEIETRAVSFAELHSYAGRHLVANLLDEVQREIATTSNQKQGGSIKVWPGQKFKVVSVSPNDQAVVCVPVETETSVESDRMDFVSVTIPKRDIELGYFSLI